MICLGFSEASSQVNSSLLVIAVIAMLIPSGFHVALTGNLDSATERDDVLAVCTFDLAKSCPDLVA